MASQFFKNPLESKTMQWKKVRGTRDLWGQEAALFRFIDENFSRIARLYNFQEIQTPIFESTLLFQRSLGDLSDIVHKEMYTFLDRNKDSITLRPEGTAPVVRSLLSNNLLRELPLKFFYSGPMFRYERPQKGRYRQFNQFGVELLGVSSPHGDMEVLSMAQHILNFLGLKDAVQLQIHSLGDLESRKDFSQKLKEYLKPYQKDLSPDSQIRLEKNPLRILDSKNSEDQKILQEAPQLKSCLNSSSRKILENTLEHLSQLGIAYTFNPKLVRGLDYYNHVVFEFISSKIGSQNALLSGGRYDGLVESLGGPPTQGVGWAAGTDRLALLLEENKKNSLNSVALIALDDLGQKKLWPLLQKLRHGNIPAQPIYTGNLSKKMKKAHNRGCRWVLILGQDGLKENKVQLKDLNSGHQRDVDWDELMPTLKKAQDEAPAE